MFDSIFQEGTSFIYHVDPRVRILSGLFTAFLIAFLKKIDTAIIAFFVSLTFILVFHLPIRNLIKTLFFANFFIAFLWLFVPFSIHGQPIFHVWRWIATVNGIKLAFLITLKCNAILMIIISFIATVPLPILGYALDSLKFPNKLILIFLMSYRYIHVIFDEYNRLTQALQIRCFKPKTNLRTYRTYAYLIAMVFIRSYERGIRIYNAMLLRGFNGKFYSLRKFHIKIQDIFLLCGLILFFSFLLIIDFSFKGTIL